MTSLFITIRFLDIIDILLVALFIYQIYKLIRGTTTFSIFAGIFTVYLIWLVVRALNMELVSAILGQLFGVGVIAMIIVFQQEIRRFLLMIGNKYNIKSRLSFENIFKTDSEANERNMNNIGAIATACKDMAITKTGALIVIQHTANIDEIIETGTDMDSIIDTDILRSIFFKNAPLHDGAVVIKDGKIKAARCILPVTESKTIDQNLGLRHRAALGLTEGTDAAVLVVSEETGVMSFVVNGDIERHLTHTQLKNRILSHMQVI